MFWGYLKLTISQWILPKKEQKLCKGKFRRYKRNIREMIKIRAQSYPKPLKNTMNRQRRRCYFNRIVEYSRMAVTEKTGIRIH